MDSYTGDLVKRTWTPGPSNLWSATTAKYEVYTTEICYKKTKVQGTATTRIITTGI
jgi:hypothetical protein